MPSCVVKSCKNCSIVQNKAVGITFHKFPTDIVWKRKWMDVIRTSRNEATWLPSQFSVVCSVHFAGEDLYQTKCGLRRVEKNAIPKHYLTPPEIDNDVPEDESVPSTSNTVTTMRIVEIKLEPCYLELQSSDKHSNDVKVLPPLMPRPVNEIKYEPTSPETLHSDNNSNDGQLTPSYTLQERVTVKVEPISPDTQDLNKSSNEMQIEPTTTAQEVFKGEIGPESLATSDRNPNIETSDTSMQEENPRCATPSLHDSDIHSIYDSPLEYKLKKQLKKQMKLAELRRKKIKVLNQKLRRMGKTNNKLRNTIKMLQEKVEALQSVHIFGGNQTLKETETDEDDLLNN